MIRVYCIWQRARALKLNFKKKKLKKIFKHIIQRYTIIKTTKTHNLIFCVCLKDSGESSQSLVC